MKPPPSRPLDCEQARELISVGADDELSRSAGVVLDTHLDSCAQCSAYETKISTLTRSIRLRPAIAEAGFVDRVMVGSRPARLGRGGWLRPALAWCGVLIVGQSIRPLVLGQLGDAPAHVARHSGSFSLALGIGLLYAAWRPYRAFGLLPFVGALLATTALGAGIDVFGGGREPLAEVVHLAEVAGMALLWFVAGSPGWERLCRALRDVRRGVARSTT